ncbi:MAG: N-acetyl-gamma-glutamyl-phosphate reductase [Alphaproteobacteria bacterium]
MFSEINVAVLGSTGYVGYELVKILVNHPKVNINFLGCDSKINDTIFNKDKNLEFSKLPKLSMNIDFDVSKSDVVFLALPHGISHKYVKEYYNKIKIIDLSADFRLDSEEIYNENYKTNHSCSNLLKEFVYGLPEINKRIIINKSNIAVPGCYPTSILLPLIPLIKEQLINLDNIIIDSKSGYSGAGKKFEISNIKNSNDLNFYNYKTNNHQHICEIKQELEKYNSKKNINFSFNPHILPVFRGIMSTIYCDLNIGITINDIKNCYNNNYLDLPFIKIKKDEEKFDLFSVQNTNNCLIKLFTHTSDNKIIIVSLIDNLIKGAAGQAIQCFNIIYNFDENLSLKN